MPRKASVHSTPKTRDLTEAQYRKRDLAIKWIGVPVLVAGAIFTWHQYYDSKELNHRLRQQAAERERLTPIRIEEDDVTKRLFEITGEITQADVSARPQIEAKFWHLYNGELQLGLGSADMARAYAKEIASCLQKRCSSSELSALSGRFGPIVQAERQRKIDEYKRETLDAPEPLRPAIPGIQIP